LVIALLPNSNIATARQRAALHLHTPRKAVAHDSHGFTPRVQYSIIGAPRKRYICRIGCEMIDAVCEMAWRFERRAAGTTGDKPSDLSAY
jgi:hypothetical protein